MKPTKLPSGNWRIQVCVGKDENGNRRYQSITRSSKRECINEANTLAAHQKAILSDHGNMTLAEAIDAYIELKSNILSPATIRGYKQIQRCYFQPEMGMKLAVIDDFTAQRAVNREAGKHSPKTVANAYGLLSAVVKTFTKRILSVQLPQKEDSDVTILEYDELEILIREIQGTKAEVPILIALFLGLRRSEIMALTYEDFDQERSILTVNKARVYDVDNNIVEKRTKTRKSKRKISVPPYLADKLLQQIEKGESFYPCHPNTPGKILNRVCKANDLQHMRLHDLRHQNASVMLSLGIADKYAMERGGWSSNRTMKNIYQHTLNSEKLLVDEKMNSYFEQLASRMLHDQPQASV